MSQDVDVQEGAKEDVKVKTEEPEEILVLAVIEKKKSSPGLTPQSAIIVRKEVDTNSKDHPRNKTEQQKARLLRNNERRRLKRAKETPEQRRERRRINSERAKAQRAKETPERRRERLRRQKERQQIRRDGLTPEQNRTFLDEDNERRRLRRLGQGTGESGWQENGGKANESPEESRALIKLGEEVKQILIEQRDKWKRKVTWNEGPDGRLLMSRVEMQRVKFNYQNFIANEKRKEKMTEEELVRQKELKNFRQLARWANMSEEEKQRLRLTVYLRRHAKMASIPKDEREEWAQRRRERARDRMRNWTEEQKQRHKDNVRKANQRKNKEKLKKYYQKYLQEKRKNETPEQRQKTLLGYRVSQAKRLLKIKLEKNGVASDEIQKQVDQLVLKMRSEPLPPPETVSQYKPHPHRKKTQGTPSESMDSSKLEVRTSIEPAASPSSTSSSSFYQQSVPVPHRVEPISNKVAEEAEAGLDNFGFFVATDDSPYSSPMASPILIPPQSSSELSSVVADYEVREQEQDLQDKLISSRNVIAQTEEVQIEVTAPQPHPASPLSSSPVECQTTETPVETILSQPLTSTTPAPSSVKCPHCPSYFPQLTELHPHIRSTHPEKCWKCPKCFAVVLSPPELAEHFKSHHQTSSGVLKKEEDIAEAPRNSNRNKRPGRSKATSKHIPVKIFPFICMKCPMRSRSPKPTRFETHEKLTQHVRVAHPKSFFPCPQCKLLKYNSSSLQIHLKICTKKLKS